MKKHFFIMLILCFITAAAPLQAFAEAEEDESVVIAEEDIFFQSIQGLIGSAANIIVGDNIQDEPDHIMGVLMNTYGYGLIMFATIFMAFRGVKWVLQLSKEKNDNSMLDFNSAPLPVAMCVIAMLPLNDGYSAMQHIVIKVAGESISLANKETYAAADYLEKYGSFTVSPVVMNTSLIVNSAFESSICMSLINATSGKTNVGMARYEDLDLENNYHSFRVSFDGIYTESEAIAQYMGEVASGAKQGLTRALPKQVCGTNSITFGAIDEKYTESAPVMDFRQGVIDAYSDMNEEVAMIAAGAIDYYTNPQSPRVLPSTIKADLQAARNNFAMKYKNQLAIFVRQIQESAQNENYGLANTNATQSLRKYGAGFLGVYFWEYARRNSVVTSLTGLSSSSSQPNRSSIIEKVPNDIYTDVTNQAKKILDSVRTDYTAQGPPNYVYKSEQLEQAVSKSLEESTAASDLSFGSYIFNFSSSAMLNQSDPVLSLADMGHSLISTGEVILTTSTTMLAIAKVSSAIGHTSADAAANIPVFGVPGILAGRGVGFSADILALGASNIIPLAITIIIFGILIAFWIPAIPLIHWINGCVGFLIVFIQAFTLTPLLGLAHLLSSEKGFLTGKTQHGYMAIIQLFSHLPLMVISFFAAYLIFMAGVKLIQITYVPFFEILNANNWTGIITGIVMLIMFLIITLQVANRCFSLITAIPEKAAKFIGGGEEMLGDNKAISQGHSNFVAVTNSGKSGMQNFTKSLAERKKENNKKREAGSVGAGDNGAPLGGNQTSQGRNINSKTK